MGQETSKQNTEADKKTTRKKKKPAASKSVGLRNLAAIIASIATISVALAPVITKLIDLRQNTPTPIVIPSATSLRIVDTVSPTQTIIPNTSTIEATETATLIPITDTPATSPNLAPGMRVVINASRTSGKAPLNINFNAGGSYLLTDDGTVIKCGACSFTWSIRLGANFIYGPEKKDATFSFTFSRKGTYFVIVKVCRNSENEACQTSGITIVAN